MQQFCVDHLDTAHRHCSSLMFRRHRGAGRPLALAAAVLCVPFRSFEQPALYKPHAVGCLGRNDENKSLAVPLASTEIAICKIFPLP